MKLVFFHGSFNSHDQIEEYWVSQLKKTINTSKCQIIFPTFPIDTWDEVTKRGHQDKPAIQTLSKWLRAFESTRDLIRSSKHLVFVGHSLGPLFILHILEKYNLFIDSAIFVSPFLTSLSKPSWQVNTVNSTFYKEDFDFAKIRSQIKYSLVIYGTDDPFVDQKQILNFGQKLESNFLPVFDGKHLNHRK